MKCSGKGTSYFFSVWIIAVFIIIPNSLFSQMLFQGKVTYQKDDMPAAYATIELLNQKEASLADKAGNFSLAISNLKKNDTLLISSTGYETLKIPALSALNKSRFVLVEKVKNLQPVTVFNTHQVLGSSKESVGYYRSWNHEKTGGEIGRIIKVPYKEYKIDKIRFKVSNLCDTCVLRLHMRNVVNGDPAEEILKDSITVTINKLTLDDKIPEFDISAYDFTFTQNEIFVSIEVLNCRSKKNENCSFNFSGTEKGVYLFKSRTASEWQTSEDYTIYLKLFLRY